MSLADDEFHWRLYKRRSGGSGWKETDMTEIRETETESRYKAFAAALAEKWNVAKHLHPFFGFFHSRVFKMLDLKVRIVNVGFNIAQSTTLKLRNILQHFIELYNSHSPSKPIRFDFDNHDEIMKMEYCVILEFFVRYLQDVRDKSEGRLLAPPEVVAEVETLALPKQIYYIEHLNQVSFENVVKHFRGAARP